MKKMLEQLSNWGYKFELTNSGSFYHMVIMHQNKITFDSETPDLLYSWTGSDMKDVVKKGFNWAKNVEPEE